MSNPNSSLTGQIHKGVEDAVNFTWNGKFSEAEAILVQKKGSNPRYALEYGMLHGIKGLMSASNEQRECLLDIFKHADGLATAAKYGEPMISDSSEEEDEAIAISAEQDCADISEHDKEKIKKLKADKKIQKADFKSRTKLAAKGGDAVDQTWKLECDVIYADALLVRSLIQLVMNSYLKGGLNLRKTWGCYYTLMQIVEKDKNNLIPNELKMNIKWGCGTFYTYLALVPAHLMKLLSAIGFISDKELGEQYLTEVFKSATIRSPLAALVLCTYYLFLPTGLGNVEHTLSKVKVILDTMNQRYPDNIHFHGWTNFYHRKRGDTGEAVTAITKAVKNSENAGEVPVLLHYLHADTMYMDLNFEAAKEKYLLILQLVKKSGSFAYTGQVVMSLAGCYAMTGDNTRAMEWLKKVSSMYNPKSKQDSNSPKFSAKVISEPRLLPLLGVYILYINRDLAHMKSQNVVKLRAALQVVTAGKDMTPVDVSGMYRLFLGVMHKSVGENDEAVALWEQIFASEKKMSRDCMVPTSTYYEMGELEYRRGNLQKAKGFFEKGMSLKGDDTLTNRYGIAMKQLRRELAKDE